MKPDERDLILYLEDIVLSMQRVEEYITGLDFKHFKQDYKTVDAVVRNFEIIGEASWRQYCRLDFIFGKEMERTCSNTTFRISFYGRRL